MPQEINSEIFFKELDKESAGLRSAAKELANLLIEIKDAPPEIQFMATASNNIGSMNIEEFADVITALKKSIDQVRSKLATPAYKKSGVGERMLEITSLQNLITIEAGELMVKAQKIAKRGG